MDPKYHCSQGHMFTVRGYVARDAQKTKSIIICPLCGDRDTNKVGSIIRRRPAEASPGSSSMDLPATIPQLEYIKGLGGSPGRVTTRREAGEYIARLKKLKEAE